jgi:DMSO/TMAO reductase YedYZ molybdopterin-dependent catalytic subunit
MEREARGFWERAGYHVRGDPRLEERYGGELRTSMQQARSRALHRDGSDQS